MNNLDVISLLRYMRNQILTSAVHRGMDWDDASNQLDALVAGNDGAYTARIQAVIEELK